jgi:hypothetical protein
VFVPKSCSAAPNAANTNEHADTDGLLVSIDTVLLDDSGNVSFSDDDSIIGCDEMFSSVRCSGTGLRHEYGYIREGVLSGKGNSEIRSGGKKFFV